MFKITFEKEGLSSVEMQLKLCIDNELTTAAINAPGKNLLSSPFLASLFISSIGEVTKCLAEP